MLLVAGIIIFHCRWPKTFMG